MTAFRANSLSRGVAKLRARLRVRVRYIVKTQVIFILVIL